MAPLISELLDLPDQVYKGDFVLNLSDGVTQPEMTLVTTSSRPNWPIASTMP